MARRMRDLVFREAQWTHRYDAHITPINRLVDVLRGAERGSVPYVAPMYGGINARLLSVSLLAVAHCDRVAERLRCGYGVLLARQEARVSCW